MIGESLARRAARARPGALDHETRWALGLASGVAVAIVGFFTLASHTSPDTWVPVIVVLFILAASIPLCGWLAHGDGRLRRILLLALVLKLVAVGPRYYMNEVFYKGEVDATRYDQAGGVFIEGFARGEWTIEGSELAAFPAQTRYVGYVTGVLYLAFGTSLAGGYFVFSWLAWLGLLAFLQSFRVAFPNAPPYLAAKLLLFFPALVFWPSSPGKDALMVAALGAATFGVVSILYGHRRLVGLVMLAVGGHLLWSVRPHVLVVLLAGLGAALFAAWRPREVPATTASVDDATGAVGRPEARQGAGSFGRLAVRLVLLALFVPAVFAALGRIDATLGEGDDGPSGVVATLDNTAVQTDRGDSSFDAVGVRSPADLPFALVSVPLRPFPFEASSPQLAISALEGMLLLALGALGARWLWMAGPAALRTQLGALSMGYALAFVVAFSNISNAGILSRQRVQLFPFLFLLACTAHALHHERRIPPAGHPTNDDDGAVGSSSPGTLELAWSRT